MSNISVIPLFSGSRGNSTLVKFPTCNILIDVGIKPKRLIERLKSEGVFVNSIDGILLTHSHSDHILGLYDLTEKQEINVYAMEQTLLELKVRQKSFIQVDGEFYVKDVKITPFNLSHDVFCVGYKMEYMGETFCYLTDMGVFEEKNFPIICKSDKVFVEANHDLEMLKKGKYPYMLKRRIRSDFGHLSNDSCALLCARLYESGTREFILGHLSEENNCPELAFSVVDGALQQKGDDYKLFVALRNGCNKLD